MDTGVIRYSEVQDLSGSNAPYPVAVAFETQLGTGRPDAGWVVSSASLRLCVLACYIFLIFSRVLGTAAMVTVCVFFTVNCPFRPCTSSTTSVRVDAS